MLHSARASAHSRVVAAGCLAEGDADRLHELVGSAIKSHGGYVLAPGGEETLSAEG